MKLKNIKIMIMITALALSLQACSVIDKATEFINDFRSASESTDTKTGSEEAKKDEGQEAAPQIEDQNTESEKAEEEKESEDPEKAGSEETEEKTNAAEETSKANDDQKEDPKEVQEAPAQAAFNPKATQEMRSVLNKYQVQLVEDDNQESSHVNMAALQSIAKFENQDSFGYIVKYADNKIGVAIRYKEAVNNFMNVFGEKAIFYGTRRKTPIRNNSPEDFKKAAQEVSNVFFNGVSTSISWSY